MADPTRDAPVPTIDGPSYDPGAVEAGIVHIGLGGFHRAHMARYTHDLMNLRGDARRWGIVGAGLRQSDRALIETLRAQGGRYTLIEREGRDESATAIAAITDVLLAATTVEPLLRAIDTAAIRIVSLTVTENGYCLDRATKTLDLLNRDIRHDIADPSAPRTAIGVLVEAFRRRYDRGARPFTALSCDNIQHNGNVLRRAAMTLAGQNDPDLADWIGDHAAFPNSMVDRITPVTLPEQIAAFQTRYGVADRAPVFSETFRQWVIEDRFVDGRPDWDLAGAQFVEDVTPYELMKLRLLNCSHLAIAGLGELAGYRLIGETIGDPLIRDYMRALMERETGPTLAPVPGIDLDRYKQRLIERFANPAITDTVERVNTDAPVNLLVDPIRDRLRSGGDITLLALGLAAWLRRVRGEDEQGRPNAVHHPLAPLLREKALAGGADPGALLSIRSLFGEVGQDAGLRDATGRWLASLYAVGSIETLRRAAREGRL